MTLVDRRGDCWLFASDLPAAFVGFSFGTASGPCDFGFGTAGGSGGLGVAAALRADCGSAIGLAAGVGTAAAACGVCCTGLVRGATGTMSGSKHSAGISGRPDGRFAPTSRSWSMWRFQSRPSSSLML